MLDRKLVTLLEDAAMKSCGYVQLDIVPADMKDHLILYKNETPLDVIVDFNTLRNYFTKYGTLLQLQRDGEGYINISCFTQSYQNEDNTFTTVSYHFAVIWKGNLISYMICDETGKGISMETALCLILTDFKIKSTKVEKVRKYTSIIGADKDGNPKEKTFNNLKDAKRASFYLYKDGKTTKTIDDWSQIPHIKINLITHQGIGALAAFDQSGDGSCEIFKFLTGVAPGTISLYRNNIEFYDICTGDAKHRKMFPVQINVRDTACYLPEKNKDIMTVAEFLSFSFNKYEYMDQNAFETIVKTNTNELIKIATKMCGIPLIFTALMFGTNCELPVTLMSVVAKSIKKMIRDNLGGITSKAFDATFRGVKRKTKDDNDPAYNLDKNLVPINEDAAQVHRAAKKSFIGGYNTATICGYFNIETTDFDLAQAYITVLCLVVAVTWDNPIKELIRDRDLTLDDFIEDGKINPLKLMFVKASFEFPQGIVVSCLPQRIGESIIFERGAEASENTYYCGPELYLALKLGARIHVTNGYILNTLVDDAGKPVYMMNEMIKYMVQDRIAAKKASHNDKKEEFIDALIKQIISSIYGKLAQNVKDKDGWSTFQQKTVNLGCSAITNPVTASYITSITRAVLIAAQIEITQEGYNVYSVTTDGMISNYPEDKIEDLKLFGLADFMRNARLYLTDGKDGNIWTVKHKQDDLFNISTRANVSLYYGVNAPYNDNYYIDATGNKYLGVCAHNGYVTGEVKDGGMDRFLYAKNVMERTGKINSIYDAKSRVGDILDKDGNRKPFKVEKKEKPVSMDFDMKRKPVWESMTVVERKIGRHTFNIVNFVTVPFEDTQQYELYKSAKDDMPVLNTLDDWNHFFRKIQQKKMQKIILDCIKGDFLRYWNIPDYHENKGTDRIMWVNQFSDGFVINADQIKNARKKARCKELLGYKSYDKMMKELGNMLICMGAVIHEAA